MPDARTRRQKIEDVLKPKSGATKGERDNARRLLNTMKAEPTPPSARYTRPAGPEAQPAGRQSRYPPESYADWNFEAEFVPHSSAAEQEWARAERGREKARQAGFWVPENEADADMTFASAAARENFRRASQGLSASDIERMFREGKITASDLRRVLDNLADFQEE